MDKVAQLVKVAKDQHLAHNERLGTVGSAVTYGAKLGASLGAPLGAFIGGRIAPNTIKGKLLGSLTGAAGGAGSLGLYGGGMGLTAGLVRSLKRKVMGQKSVSHAEYDARKTLTKEAGEKLKGSAEVLGGMGIAAGGLHAAGKMSNAGYRIAAVHNKAALKHIEKGNWVKAERSLANVVRGGKKVAGSKLLAAASILGGAGLAYKGGKDAMKK